MKLSKCAICGLPVGLNNYPREKGHCKCHVSAIKCEPKCIKYCTVDGVDIKEKQPCIVFEKDAAIPYDCTVLMRLREQGKTHEDCEYYKEAEKTVFERATEIKYKSIGLPMLIVSYNFDTKRWSACLRNHDRGVETQIQEPTAEAACEKLLELWEKANK